MTDDRRQRGQKRRELEDMLRDPQTHMKNATEVHVLDVDILSGEICRNNAERGEAVTGDEGYIGDVALHGNAVVTHMEDYERVPHAQSRFPALNEAFRHFVRQIRKTHRRTDDDDNPK